MVVLDRTFGLTIRRSGSISKIWLPDVVEASLPGGPHPFLGLFDPESVSMWPGIRVIVTSKFGLKAGILTQIPGHINTDSGSNWPRNGSGPLGPKSGSILTRDFGSVGTKPHYVHVHYVSANQWIFILDSYVNICFLWEAWRKEAISPHPHNTLGHGRCWTHFNGTRPHSQQWPSGRKAKVPNLNLELFTLTRSPAVN